MASTDIFHSGLSFLSSDTYTSSAQMTETDFAYDNPAKPRLPPLVLVLARELENKARKHMGEGYNPNISVMVRRIVMKETN